MLDTATLTMRKDGEGQKDFYLLTMTSVTVLGVQKTVSNGTPVAVEKVVLSPKVATTKYKPQDEKGGLGGEVVGTVTCP